MFTKRDRERLEQVGRGIERMEWVHSKLDNIATQKAIDWAKEPQDVKSLSKKELEKKKREIEEELKNRKK